MIIRSLLLLTSVASLAMAQAQTFSASVLQADFDVLKGALAEAHGGYDRFAPRAEVDRRLAGYRSRLDRPMTALEFSGVVAEAVAGLRDGHLRPELDTATARRLSSARVFPLRLFAQGTQLFVLFNDTPADSVVKPGMELLRVNGRSIEQLRATLVPKISGDGFIETGKRTRFVNGFANLFWQFVDTAGRFTVEARDSNGRVVVATLDGVLAASRRMNTNPVNAPVVAALARIDTTRGNVTLDVVGDVHRLRVRSFSPAGIPAALDSVFRLLAERKADRLILDLRGNGGGTDEDGALLVSHLVDRPFRYFDRITVRTITPSFATWLPRTSEGLKNGTVADSGGGFRVLPTRHRGVAEQQPAANAFHGRLVVLIDGGSFSTTADVAAQLRSMGRATFVGEETSGGYEGNTSGLNADIVLPATKLKLRVMMYDYWNAVKPPAVRGRGTLPDHEVAPAITDVLAGRDVVLERALALIR
jgi:hypothetical protein